MTRPLQGEAMEVDVRSIAVGVSLGAATIADGADVAQGALADAAVVAGATGSVSAKLRSISRDTGALTETAPATDTASSGLNGRLQRIAQRLTSLIALFPTALGGTTSANSLPVVLSSDGPFAVQTGSITETAPATDTASSGLNGRLQRIAQNLTTLFTRFVAPATLASGTAVPSTTIVGSVPMVFDGTNLAMQIATQEGTLLASAVRAATNSTADQTNYTAKGVIIWWNMTNVPSVDTVTLTVTGKDPISGNYVTILTSTATATTGQRGYIVYPGAVTSSLAAIAGVALPRIWRVTMTHSAATNFTYSVGYTLLP